MLVAPSILSANFGILNKEIEAICQAGCDLVHVDVMDGHFVPNLTVGPIVVKAISKVATKPLDIHLMVENNNFFVELFAPLCPKYLSFHVEEEKHPHRLIQKIRSYNINPSITLNPGTSLQSIEWLLEEVDMVLLMSVNPGFSGQSFIKSSLKKIENLKEMIVKKGLKTLIEIDGGVSDKNIVDLKNAGVDIVVAGNYIFSSSSYKNAIESLRV